MEKICQQCKQSFTQKENIRGSEQKYCSVKCRQTSSHLRMINKIKDNAKQEATKEIQIGNINNTETLDRRREREFETIDSRIGDNSLSYWETINRLFEAKNEVVFYKLKCEQLEKENNKLIIEVANLEQELSEIDEGEEVSGINGMLGAVMDQFKQDPITSVNFATELIGNLFKTKKNETTVKS